MDVLEVRSRPAAAVMLALTRRCPLKCRHCSTESLMNSEQHDAEIFENFVAGFTPENRPDYVLMSGGEVLLRPRLVQRIAERCREVGAQTHILSGMFFARSARVPDRIMAAIDAVDHFSASLDTYHEEEVPREDVLRVLRQLLDAGKDVSLQVVGLDEEDPYLVEATGDIREALDDRAPIWVSLVQAGGRAKEWLDDELIRRGVRPTRAQQDGSGSPAVDPHRLLPAPCSLAAWPLVSFDGTVVACCNQDVVDGLGGRLPAHLRLGHAAEDPWEELRRRHLDRHLLRGIRAFGPQYLADQAGAGCGEGYCASCFKLSADPATSAGVRALMHRPSTVLMEQQITRMVDQVGPAGFARRYGTRRYGHLLLLGHPDSAELQAQYTAEGKAGPGAAQAGEEVLKCAG
nr:radical SAM protein [Streptomyces scabichelini]